MGSKRLYLFSGVILFLVLLPLGGGTVKADPMPVGDLQVKEKGVVPPEGLPNVSAVRNPHGFLEFDGTGYHVVTRETKPRRASYIRLKPVPSSKGKGANSTVYTLEVLDEKTSEGDKEPAGSAEDKPHFAIERVEDLDKKGVAVEPRREHKADVGLGIKLSESSEVMVGRNLVVERKHDRRLDSRDDGWRFRFKTNF